MSALSRTTRSQLLSVIVVAALVGLASAYFAGALTSPSGHTLTAEFADAQSISKGNTVHVAGVTAGTVTSVRLDHGKARLTLHLDPGFWPIHSDATADVRPVSLLGEDYVDLEPGTPSYPALPDHATIAEDHTTNSVNLQSVLDAVNDPTATGLALLLTSFGQGAAGNGANGAEDLKALAPALDDTTALAKLLDSQDATLQSLLDQVTPVTDALASDNGHTMDALVGATTSTLQATAAQSTALGADLQALPGFLTGTTAAFNHLGTLADQATPALAALDPLTSQLTQFSSDLKAFAAAAQPAAASLTPVLARADDFFKQTGPVVSSLDASAPQQPADAAALIPIVRQGITGTCSATDCPGLDDIFGFVRNWALATQNYDGLSHYFRFFTNFSNDAVGGVPGIGQLLAAGSMLPQPAAPAKVAGPPVTAPAVTVPKVAPPIQVPGLPALRLPSVTVPAQPAPVGSPTTTSATGLSPTQERNLFGYLLGGA